MLAFPLTNIGIMKELKKIRGNIILITNFKTLSIKVLFLSILSILFDFKRILCQRFFSQFV